MTACVYVHPPTTKKSVNVAITDGIERVGQRPASNAATYNLNGQQVDDSYKGLIIKDRKKILKR